MSDIDELVAFIRARLDKGAPMFDARIVSPPGTEYLSEREDDAIWHVADIESKRAMLDWIDTWKHQEVEDCWYSCPLSDEGCCDEDREAKCTCWVSPVRERFLRLLALPFADHPDYQEGWRP